MKKIYLIAAGLLLLLRASVFAQAPQKMGYQAVIRSSSNTLITSAPIGMKISVLQGTSTGAAVYSETQTVSTNANGLVSLEIGSGTPVTGTFAGIDWAAGPYFIKTETDPAGGTTYSITGTNQLMSVPYALFSANGTPGAAGATGATGATGARGLTGATGAAGTNGTNGAIGATGAAGTNGANAAVGGFTHYIGEAFNGGIIYHLYKGSDNLEHGLIVSLTESSYLAWQTSGTLVNANRSEDGVYNTNLMTGSPAATYIAALGAGWYLPSIDELGLLYYNRYRVQKALRAGGNALIQSTFYYWSSTEYNAATAYALGFGGGFVDICSKSYTTHYSARGIKAF